MGLPVLPSIPAKGAVPCETFECSACCHDIEMILTDDDLVRLGAARPKEDFWFRADDGYVQLRTRDGPAAKGGSGKPCWFLDAAGRCTVWQDRPEGCRLYPAMWAETEADLDADYCPHTDGFQLTRQVSDATRRLAARLEAERMRRIQGPPGSGARHE